MNQRKQYIRLILLVVCLAGQMDAAGTPAGTVLQSRSRATYTTASGTGIDTVYSGVVSITVKQAGSVNVNPIANGLTSQTDSTVVDYPFVVTNSGNGADRIGMTAVSTRGWVTQLFADANRDGVLQTAERSAGTVTQSPVLAADAQFAVIARLAVPRGESLVGTKDSLFVTVKSNFDSAKSAVARYITTVQSADLRGISSGLSVNNPAPQAGSNLTYTLSFTNNGMVAASNVVISDLLPNGFTIVSGAGTQGTFSGTGNPVLWNFGTLLPGATATVTLTVSVNSTVIPGTVIANQMVVSYSVLSNNYTVGSNVVVVTTAGIATYGVAVGAPAGAQVREPSDTALYHFVVRNTGSFRDVIEVSHTSTRNFIWSHFHDKNNNAVFDPNDTPLTNTNGSAGVDVDTVAAGDSVRIFSRAVVPRSKMDQVKDTLAITVRSSGDNTKTSSVAAVTTVLEPLVTMDLSVFPVGDQPAGSIVTYTIRYNNIGSTAVINFKVVDTTPAQTEYVSNSVKVNGTAVNDNTGSLSVLDDPENNKIISVTIGTLAAAGSGSVEFKVRIK